MDAPFSVGPSVRTFFGNGHHTLIPTIRRDCTTIVAGCWNEQNREDKRSYWPLLTATICTHQTSLSFALIAINSSRSRENAAFANVEVAIVATERLPAPYESRRRKLSETHAIVLGEGPESILLIMATPPCHAVCIFLTGSAPYAVYSKSCASRGRELLAWKCETGCLNEMLLALHYRWTVGLDANVCHRQSLHERPVEVL